MRDRWVHASACMHHNCQAGACAHVSTCRLFYLSVVWMCSIPAPILLAAPTSARLRPCSFVRYARSAAFVVSEGFLICGSHLSAPLDSFKSIHSRHLRAATRHSKHFEKFASGQTSSFSLIQWQLGHVAFLI